MKAAAEGIVNFTDDTGQTERAGMRVELSDEDPSNFKIATATDLERANRQAKATPLTDKCPLNHPLSQLQDIRTGIGYDVHAFDEGDLVTLGGVDIPHIKRLKGHSDADVVLHAITDATHGAICDGDIGEHFPPSDPQWKRASSDRFQVDKIERVNKLGGRHAHIDVTIVCENPK